MGQHCAAGFSISISKFLNSKFIYCEAAHTRYYAYEQSSLAHLYSSFFNLDLKLEIGNVFANKRVVGQWCESGDWLGKIGCVVGGRGFEPRLGKSPG